jgi:type IV pilus assembly protein PilP
MNWKADSNRRQVAAPPFLALMTLVLAACGADQSDLRDYINEVKDRHRRPVPEVPTVEPFEGFSYAASELRDPFQPHSRRIVVDPHPDMNRPREYLEEFVLNQLSLVGTLRQEERRWALIEAPDGEVHRVSTGNYLGRNYGQIVQIDASMLTLREIVPDGMGGWTEQFTEVSIQAASQ